MHTVFALLCFVIVIHWPIFPYPSGLLHWHCGNLTIAPVPAKQPWWIWINTSCEFIMNDCITTTKQSTTKPCAYFLGYTVFGDNSDCISDDDPMAVNNTKYSQYITPHTYQMCTYATQLVCHRYTCFLSGNRNNQNINNSRKCPITLSLVNADSNNHIPSLVP